MRQKADADEAAQILEEDPFMRNGVFELEEIREWNVFVDELSSGTASETA